MLFSSHFYYGLSFTNFLPQQDVGMLRTQPEAAEKDRAVGGDQHVSASMSPQLMILFSIHRRCSNVGVWIKEVGMKYSQQSDQSKSRDIKIAEVYN